MRKTLKDSDGGEYSASESYVFRGIEYEISFQSNDDNLTIEVQDKVTTEQWRGKFDCNYVEDLTHKTGNFKQFPVFVSMLENALLKQSDSVGLDLLTYADLEMLRNRKIGSKVKSTSHNPKKMIQQNKRYLILVYSVEFDRIHYPLPLIYQGKPDPIYLQNIIQELQKEIRMLKQSRFGLQDADYQQLKEDYEALLREKNILEAELDDLKSCTQNQDSATFNKEVRILKKVVQNLELDMVKEKNKYQRQLSKKSTEIKRLANELAELHAKERTSQLRVKSLTNEIATYKRNRTPIPSSGRSISSMSGYRRSNTTQRRPNIVNRSMTSNRRPTSRSRERPPVPSHERSVSRDRARSSLRNRSRTPTPRFDPTSYVEEKKRKLRESEERIKRRTSSGGRYNNTSSGDSRGRARARVNAAYGQPRVNTARSSSRESERNSRSRVRHRSSSAESRGSYTNFKPRRKTTVAWEDSTMHDMRRRSSTPDPDVCSRKKKPSEKLMGGTGYDVDMAEIDARLNALQEYMKEIGS